MKERKSPNTNKEMSVFNKSINENTPNDKKIIESTFKIIYFFEPLVISLDIELSS